VLFRSVAKFLANPRLETAAWEARHALEATEECSHAWGVCECPLDVRFSDPSDTVVDENPFLDKHTWMNGPYDDAACEQCTDALLKQYPDADPAEAYVLWPCDTAIDKCSDAWKVSESPVEAAPPGYDTDECDPFCWCLDCQDTWKF
jgi:hypothetical protein